MPNRSRKRKMKDSASTTPTSSPDESNVSGDWDTEGKNTKECAVDDVRSLSARTTTNVASAKESAAVVEAAEEVSGEFSGGGGHTNKPTSSTPLLLRKIRVLEKLCEEASPDDEDLQAHFPSHCKKRLKGCPVCPAIKAYNYIPRKEKKRMWVEYVEKRLGNGIFQLGHGIPGPRSKGLACRPCSVGAVMCVECEQTTKEISTISLFDHGFTKYVRDRVNYYLAEPSAQGATRLRLLESAKTRTYSWESDPEMAELCCENNDCYRHLISMQKEFIPTDLDNQATQFLLREAKQYEVNVLNSKILRLVLLNLPKKSTDTVEDEIPKSTGKCLCSILQNRPLNTKDFPAFTVTQDDSDAVVWTYLNYFDAYKNDALLIIAIAELIGADQDLQKLVDAFENLYGSDSRLEKLKFRTKLESTPRGGPSSQLSKSNMNNQFVPVTRVVVDGPFKLAQDRRATKKCKRTSETSDKSIRTSDHTHCKRKRMKTTMKRVPVQSTGGAVSNIGVPTTATRTDDLVGQVEDLQAHEENLRAVCDKLLGVPTWEAWKKELYAAEFFKEYGNDGILLTIFHQMWLEKFGHDSEGLCEAQVVTDTAAENELPGIAETPKISDLNEESFSVTASADSPAWLEAANANVDKINITKTISHGEIDAIPATGEVKSSPPAKPPRLMKSIEPFNEELKTTLASEPDEAVMLDEQTLADLIKSNDLSDSEDIGNYSVLADTSYSAAILSNYDAEFHGSANSTSNHDEALQAIPAQAKILREEDEIATSSEVRIESKSEGEGVMDKIDDKNHDVMRGRSLPRTDKNRKKRGSLYRRFQNLISNLANVR